MRYLGRELEVTCMKSPKFQEIWDDKAVRVRVNTGELDFYDPEAQSRKRVGVVR